LSPLSALGLREVALPQGSAVQPWICPAPPPPKCYMPRHLIILDLITPTIFGE